MLDAGSRRRNLPAPPHVVGESLCEPDRDPARPYRRRLDELIHANLRHTYGR